MRPSARAREKPAVSELISMSLEWGAGTRRPFYYRLDSIGDHGVVAQTFHARQYDLADFPLTGRVLGYAAAAEAGGRQRLVVDLGANIGATAVYFSGEYPDCLVVAVEPEPHNHALLTRNCEGLNVRAVEAAISCEPGTLFLVDPDESDWGFRVSDTGDQAVRAVTMDELMRDLRATRCAPFICKIDIEGSEARLFERHIDWMDEFPVVIIELHDWMLPGSSNSRSWFRALGRFHFDVVWRGENAFCFNNRLLAAFA